MAESEDWPIITAARIPKTFGVSQCSMSFEDFRPAYKENREQDNNSPDDVPTPVIVSLLQIPC